MNNKTKLALMAASLLVSSASFASQKLDTCKIVATAASNPMSGRQNGVEAAEVYEKIETKMTDGPEKNMMTIMVGDAYQYPKMHSQQFIDRAIAEFKNKYFIACMMGIKE